MEDEVDRAGYDGWVMDANGTGSMERVVGDNAMAVLLKKVLIADDEEESEKRILLSGIR